MDFLRPLMRRLPGPKQPTHGTNVLQAFRKGIGVKIREETEIIEGEVLKCSYCQQPYCPDVVDV